MKRGFRMWVKWNYIHDLVASDNKETNTTSADLIQNNFTPDSENPIEDVKRGEIILPYTPLIRKPKVMLEPLT